MYFRLNGKCHLDAEYSISCILSIWKHCVIYKSLAKPFPIGTEGFQKKFQFHIVSMRQLFNIVCRKRWNSILMLPEKTAFAMFHFISVNEHGIESLNETMTMATRIWKKLHVFKCIKWIFFHLFNAHKGSACYMCSNFINVYVCKTFQFYSEMNDFML